MRNRLYKRQRKACGQLGLGEGMKCHSLHIMNLLSVSKETPLACGQPGLEWPGALAYSSASCPVLQAPGSLSWNPYSQLPLVLFCAISKLGHLGLPSVWEKELDSDTSAPWALKALVPTRNIGQPAGPCKGNMSREGLL